MPLLISRMLFGPHHLGLRHTCLRVIQSVGLLCALTIGFSVRVQPQSLPQEYEVKAAFLYNFAKFVEWPAGTFPDASSPIVIGVLGEDPFGDVLDRTVSGKLVQGRPLRVRRWKQISDVERCQILFVGTTQEDLLAAMLNKVGTSPVLTVSDAGEFGERGAIIHFNLVENKVRFEINNRSARRAGLRISSRLLMLALHVWE